MSDSVDEWTEADTEAYRDIARYAVPERERQIEIITALVQLTDIKGDILDLCCGEGLLSSAIMSALPDARLLAYDGSETMLAETRGHTPDRGRLTTRRIDLSKNDWRRFENPLRAVVSSLAVHHLDGPQKRQLFSDLHAALSPGGVFVLADLILLANSVSRRIAASIWDEEVRRRALDLDGTLDGFAAFERAKWNYYRQDEQDDIDKPSTLTEHFDWLRAAGFADVDLHWMMAGHVIISGWRR